MVKVKETIKTTSVFIIIGIIVQFVFDAIDSKFLEEFLNANLITLLVALTAINATTLGVIMTKLKEILDIAQGNGSFSVTIDEMKMSIDEQVWLIIIASIILVTKNSKLVALWEPLSFILNVVLYTVFFYAIYLLQDTGKAVFILADFQNDKK